MKADRHGDQAEGQITRPDGGRHGVFSFEGTVVRMRRDYGILSRRYREATSCLLFRILVLRAVFPSLKPEQPPCAAKGTAGDGCITYVLNSFLFATIFKGSAGQG